jgi:RimJ/RimL family protein N-acetyltransferase
VRRHEYRLELGARYAAPEANEEIPARHPAADDAAVLAVLMLDAYLGTIDYEGETIVEARQEVAGYLAGTPLLDCSWLHVAGEVPVSACLVSWWTDRGCPIVSYVMTAPERKGEGLAAALLARSLASLVDAGHAEVRAAITEGNVPSERAFARAGFRRV